VTTSYDATTQFETTCDDVLKVYEKVMGKPFDFTGIKSEIQEAGQ